MSPAVQCRMERALFHRRHFPRGESDQRPASSSNREIVKGAGSLETSDPSHTYCVTGSHEVSRRGQPTEVGSKLAIASPGAGTGTAWPWPPADSRDAAPSSPSSAVVGRSLNGTHLEAGRSHPRSALRRSVTGSAL